MSPLITLERLRRRTVQHGECWLWDTGTRDYARISVGGRVRLAHRVAYELAHGAVPPGLFVLHRCDNKPCVNPAHLFVGTQQQNLDDAKAKGRTRRGERHWNVKLSAADVREIRRRRAQGERIDALAEFFGVAKSSISRVANNKQWAMPRGEQL